MYLTDLGKVDLAVLRSILEASFAHVLAEKTTYGTLTVID